MLELSLFFFIKSWPNCEHKKFPLFSSKYLIITPALDGQLTVSSGAQETGDIYNIMLAHKPGFKEYDLKIIVIQ